MFNQPLSGGKLGRWGQLGAVVSPLSKTLRIRRLVSGILLATGNALGDLSHDPDLP